MSAKSGIADRVAKIFQVILESDHPVSLTTIAKGAGIHYRTAQQYIDLIVDIQKRPKLEKIESERTVLVRRDPG